MALGTDSSGYGQGMARVGVRWWLQIVEMAAVHSSVQVRDSVC
jgi:hypothetical protein